MIEAWHVGGVLHNANPGVRHTPGTVIDIYDVKGMTAEVQQRAEQWLKRQLGKRYDFGSVFRFLSRDEKDWSACEWFCSELVMEALMHGGIKLLNIESHKVSPEVLSWSPLLKLSNTVVTD